MIDAREEFIMDGGSGTTFGKEKLISLTKPVAVITLVFVLGCIAGTGLVVYHLSACSPEKRSEEPQIASLNNNNIRTSTQKITTSTTEKSVISTETNEKILKETPEEIENPRLPQALRPHSYDIRLIPFIQENNFTFFGHANILINVTEQCENITLHAIDLTIDEVVVVSSTQKLIPIKSVLNETRRQFIVIFLDEPLQKQFQYYVSIRFKGALNDYLQGFYRSSYKTNNETR